MEVLDNPFLVECFGVCFGGLFGAAVYSAAKRAAVRDGSRSGYLVSFSMRLCAILVGALLGYLIASWIFQDKVRKHLNWQDEVKEYIIYLPVIMEVLAIIFKSDLLTFVAGSDGDQTVEERNKALLLRASLADRIKYTLYVVNVCMTAYVAGKAPEKMPYWFTLKTAIFMPIRFYEFRVQKMHLYNYELCLFVNYFLVAYLWLPGSVFETLSSFSFPMGYHLPTRKEFFLALFGLANGPVGWYIISFNGTLSFFDRGRTTSAFVHFGPPLVTYCLRHFSADLYEVGSDEDASSIIRLALFMYLTWASFQYFVILGVYFSTIQEKDLVCVWMEATFDPIRKFTRVREINKMVYFLIHGAVAATSISMTPYLYLNEDVHFAFIFGLAAFAVWNGSADTLDRFQESYQQELKDRLKIVDDDAPEVDSKIVEELKEMVVSIRGEDVLSIDKVGSSSLTELGLDSMRIGMVGSRIQDSYQIYDLELSEIQNKNCEQIAALVGERRGKGGGKIQAAPKSFTEPNGRKDVALADGKTIAEIFLNQCDRMGSAAALADDSKPGGNILDYSKCKLGSVLIAEYIHAQGDMVDDRRVGVMMPSASGSSLIIMGLLICGKVPVMLNFTIGAEKMAHSIRDSGIRKIITSRKFVNVLLSKNTDLPAGVGEQFLFIEDLMESFTTLDLIIAKFTLGSKSASSLLKRYCNSHTPEDHAVILFTSGSTSMPKGVPLTNQNLIADVKGVITRAEMTSKDIIMAALPPFHSFGFTASVVVPCLFGIKCVYYPNPTAFFDIGRQMARWQPTIYFSTPSWMLKVYSATASKPEWSSSLRLIVVGAEACPTELKEKGAKKGVQVVEGYGITETSPVLTTGLLDMKHRGVGWPIPGVDLRLVQLDDLASVQRDPPNHPAIERTLKEKKELELKLKTEGENSREGKLLRCRLARPMVSKEIRPGDKDEKGEPALGVIIASGPNIFGDPLGESYLNRMIYDQDPKSGKYSFDPYIEYDGKFWYNTEDLGRYAFNKEEDEKAIHDGVPSLLISGRIKRFVKRGGEMISLGAIEDALFDKFPEVEQKRTVGVESITIKGDDGSIEPFVAALICDVAVKEETQEMTEGRVKEAMAHKFGVAANLFMPDAVFVVNELPMLGTGKLDLQACKKVILERYALKRRR
eukprot:CAMPEP_0201489040 /NCGR_PEP_ID=MMETSP0151_2-20130828/20979_1 /ASSEMBLY_ACC=CAM_ASM_000257 /TAXON_ID=200890 /ORGANISM="Paramoeba atlantica, Strain 621/1 / CCAP 1560/9" /LENGTH=1156 /DNA_ID=CAMNT_0047874505 /DNA_START=26 /DNA_END=3496 /DNA_ORIENTATION=-